MFTTLLAAIAMAVPAPQAQPEGFPDVPRNHWAYPAVTHLKQLGILVGYPK